MIAPDEDRGKAAISQSGPENRAAPLPPAVPPLRRKAPPKRARTHGFVKRTI